MRGRGLPLLPGFSDPSASINGAAGSSVAEKSDALSSDSLEDE
jgi:hypothetical protein